MFNKKTDVIAKDVYQSNYHQQQIAQVKAEICAVEELLISQGTLRDQLSKPVYLVAGIDRAGKSTFLHQAGLESKEQSTLPKHIHLTNDATYIEINDKPIDDKLPRQCSSRLKIKGAILCIDMDALAQTSPSQQQIRFLQNTISVLSHAFTKGLPLILLFNKMDALPGFNAFFAGLDESQREGCWGFELNPSDKKAKTPFTQQLHHQYNQFSRELHQHLLSRLYNEPRAEQRTLIHDFTLQLDSLQNKLLNFIQQLHDIGLGKIRGCYFASSIQTGFTLDRLALPLQQNFALAPTTQAPRRVTDKPYFINQLLTQTLPNLNKKALLQRLKQQYLNHLIYASAGLILTGSLIGSAYLLKNDITQLNQASVLLSNHVSLNELQNNTMSLKQLLDLLNTVRQVYQTTQSHQLVSDILDKLPLSSHHHLSEKAKQTYQFLLRQRLLPFLQQDLALKLHRGVAGDSHRLYQNLRVYLMLGDSSKMQPIIFMQWAQHFAHTSLTPKAATEFMQHIQLLLTQPLPELPTDDTLVSASRRALSHLPKLMLASILLQAKPTSLSPLLPSSQQVLQLSDNNIPFYFSKKGMDDFNNKTKNQIVQQALHGNWVLGSFASPNNKETASHLDTAFARLYQQDYIAWWQNKINRISPTSYTDLSQLRQGIDQLSQANSPLQTLFTVVHDNTEQLSLNPINMAALAGRDHTLSLTLRTKLRALDDYLTKIQHSDQPNRAAFLAVKQRLMPASSQQNPISQLESYAHQLPQPVNRWLVQLGRNSWRLLMQASASFINQQWLYTVANPYQETIAGRYPFSSKGTQEVSLAHFNHFFASNGLITNFYQHNIKCFLDTNHGHWQAKDIDDTKMPFSAAAMDLFERSYIINLMFYPEHGTKPHVDFSLQATALKPGVEGVRFSLDHQTQTASSHHASLHHLHWPNPGPSRASIEFIDNHGGHSVQQTTGPWALFKLLDRAKIKPNADSTHYDVIFSQQQMAAKYRLTTSQKINPFMANIINRLRCPRQLIDYA